MFKLDDSQVRDGTVLTLGIQYEGQTTDKVWTYAVLKAGGLWYATGNGPVSASWSAINRWLGKDGRIVLWVKVATEWADLYPLRVEGERAAQVIWDERPSYYDLPHR